MKYIKLFENFESHDPYELMIIPPNKKAEMIVEEIKKAEPNLNLVSDLIVLGANVNWQDEENYNSTPLHWAASRGQVEIARMLIDAGADVNVQDKWEHTPLHVAALNGSVEIARILIDAKANLNLQDEWGQTPLHRATLYGQEKIVKMLIDAGADLNLQDEDGYTPLHYIKDIRISVGVKIARMLIEGGADETILDNDGFRWDEICGWDRDYIESDYDYD